MNILYTSNLSKPLSVCVALVFLLLLPTLPAFALDAGEMTALLAKIDERSRTVGDYKALAYMERKEKGKSDLIYQMVMYRRDKEDKFLILFV